MPPTRTWILPACSTLLLLLATAWFFAAQQRQTVDPGNRALKAPGTADERHGRELGALVASEQALLIAYEVPGGLPILPVDAAAIAEVHARIAAAPGVGAARRLPSPSESMALIAVDLPPQHDGDLAAAIEDLARSHGPRTLECRVTGLPLLERRIAELVAGERRSLIPVLALCLFAGAWLAYRRLALAAAVLLPAVLAIVWTGGIVASLGHPLDPVGALLDPVLLTIGVATSVHFVENWRRARTLGLDAAAASRQAHRHMQAPTLLATATTMVGLLSLVASPVPAVADFGLHAAFGVALVHVFVFLVLPRWLAWRGGVAPPPSRSSWDAGPWCARLRRRALPIGAAAVAATALAAAALPGLRADNEFTGLLPPTERCRRDHDELAARLGGVEVFHMLAPARSAATDASRLLPFLASACALPLVAGLAGNVVTNAEGTLAVPLLLAPGGSQRRVALFDDLERTATVLGLDGLVPAGPAVQIARDSDRLVRSLVGSTLATLALLGLGMCIGLRSWRLGLLGMVPTTLPCIWVYGALAAADRPVSVATAMIACTMLGLLVDNTIHLLHQYRHERQRGTADAVGGALSRVGRPMALSSALLTTGFAVAATSELATTVEFAALACATIAAAWFACSALLPLLLMFRATPALESPHAS